MFLEKKDKVFKSFISPFLYHVINMLSFSFIFFKVKKFYQLSFIFLFKKIKSNFNRFFLNTLFNDFKFTKPFFTIYLNIISKIIILYIGTNRKTCIKSK